MQDMVDNTGRAVAQFGGIGLGNFDQGGGLLSQLQPLMSQNPLGGLNFFGNNMGLMNQGHDLLDRFGNAQGTNANAIPVGQFQSMLEEIREAA